MASPDIRIGKGYLKLRTVVELALVAAVTLGYKDPQKVALENLNNRPQQIRQIERTDLFSTWTPTPITIEREALPSECSVFRYIPDALTACMGYVRRNIIGSEPTLTPIPPVDPYFITPPYYNPNIPIPVSPPQETSQSTPVPTEIQPQQISPRNRRIE
jgi:hypothetical protein